jgi:hypothetical protein
MRDLLLVTISLLFLQCANSKEKIIYDDNKILSKFDSILNNDIPIYQKINPKGFSHNSKGEIFGYSIFDLTDTLNSSMKLNDKINFFDQHFYHISPVLMYMSYSYIIYLENGKIKVFNRINCLDEGDDIDKVLKFANKKLDKDEYHVLLNIKNYRKFGQYYSSDNYGARPNCKCFPCY